MPIAPVRFSMMTGVPWPNAAQHAGIVSTPPPGDSDHDARAHWNS
jgi:hypothetical protein